MAEARRRAFDAVVVFRFDRFARSVSHLARALDEFRALGIEFVSLHEAVDTSTPMGRAMFHIAGAFAELEREIIRERVRGGLKNARRRGKRLGRPRAFVNTEVVMTLTAKGLRGPSTQLSGGVFPNASPTGVVPASLAGVRVNGFAKEVANIDERRHPNRALKIPLGISPVRVRIPPPACLRLDSRRRGR